MIRAVIIDDEINSRAFLTKLLVNYCEGVEVLGSAEGVQSGIELIRRRQPDLVFLDIQMPDGNGFDLLDACKPYGFKVVFVAGYDHYAIKAIKYAAMDYLVKPISFIELRQVIQRLSCEQRAPELQMSWLEKHLHKAPFQTIILNQKDKKIVVPFDDIIYLQAQGRQVKFVLEKKLPITIPQTLNYYADVLPANIFVRIHKSFLVNLAKVLRFDKGRAGNIYLNNGESLTVAARRKNALLELWRTFKNPSL
ncbi:MAG: LytTR family DNA-binding domain-containing protein [Bacteroidota bacterium]